jgi:hypothetical protein
MGRLSKHLNMGEPFLLAASSSTKYECMADRSPWPPLLYSCLDGWATQGVLLLNACLTVSAGAAGSHHNKGWEPFTQTVLRAIADDASHGVKASVKNSTIATMFSKIDPNIEKKAAKVDEAKDKGESKKDPSSSSSSSKGVVFLAWGLPAAKSLAEAGITEVSWCMKKGYCIESTERPTDPLSFYQSLCRNLATF